MEQRSYSISVPGSLMLFGEHAVLRYREAIVCAIDRRLNITLSPKTDNSVVIRSNKFPELITNISNIQIQSPYEYVLAAILDVNKHLTNGCIIEITSDIDSTIGFGSSAAVTVAIVGVLAEWLNLSYSKEDVFIKSKEVMLAVQKVGSGADLAASVYGGVVHYKREPFKVEELPIIDNLVAVYSGSKLSTKEVLTKVESNNKVYPEIYDYVFQAITSCVRQAVSAIKVQNWMLVGKLFTLQHSLMRVIGVSNTILDELVDDLHKYGVIGAKISGSGLGDCVIGLGKIANNSFPKNIEQQDKGIIQIPISISTVGLVYE